jgi:hypothetical protein
VIISNKLFWTVAMQSVAIDLQGRLNCPESCHEAAPASGIFHMMLL